MANGMKLCFGGDRPKGEEITSLSFSIGGAGLCLDPTILAQIERQIRQSLKDQLSKGDIINVTDVHVILEITAKVSAIQAT